MMGMLGSPLPESALSPRKAIDEPPVENDPDALVGWLSDRTKATLELKDGTIFDGYSFGHHESIAGEVVFNTGMVGYPESLTDPSYAGQILVITFPLVGNYGVPAEERDEHGLMKGFESDKIHVKAVIVADYSFVTSHYTARRTLSEWLKQHKIPGIYGVDTRAITKQIRKHGAILGKVHIEGCTKEIEWEDPNLRNLAGEVSRKAPQVFEPPPLPEGTKAGRGGTDSEMLGEGDKTIHIMAVDCGMKNNIIRYMVNSLRVKLTVVPWDYNFVDEKFDGLFLSNGPGDPKQCQETIKNVQTLMEKRPMCPIFGICLGNQILALAAGATTYKMKFGNRGMNQPCVDLRTTRCYITPQNHGFAVDTNSLPGEWMPLMVNANDGSNEGIVHRLRPWFSVQFHPEACGGPTDTAFLFWHFLRNVAKPTMPSITTIPYSMPASFRKVLLLGSGGLTIGQAGEFDYSGSQALKALRESGIHTIVLNPNIATVQTSAGMADRIYFLPVTVEFVTEVIKRERPDGILCTFGGQTALNCGVKLNERGILQKYGVQVLGTPIQAIITTEDRELFAKAVVDCGYKVAESECCTTTEQAVAAAESIGYPVLVRAAFALGGLGSGFAQDVNQLHKLLKQAFVNSSQVIIDKSLKGWKELEYEVVRDGNDNCITVCNMENLDPMGIHTGDSIVIAPSQTLTNAEYYRLRECALKVVRHLGVVGECNIQYAVDPQSHEFRIIEVNARLSRSSALASKATGYPLAYVAAKLALGHDLVTLRNSVTKCTTACFEPSLDYVVAKIPRWDLRKFSTVDPAVGSAMKSVGEVMSIGRTFEETIQKALRMVDDSSVGFDADRFDQELSTRGVTAADAIADSVKAELTRPSPMRIWAVAKAFEMGMRVEDIHELTKIDRWFLSKLFHIHQVKTALQNYDIGDLANEIPLLQEAKRCGFADKQIANQLKVREAVSPTTIVSKFSKYSPVIKPAVSPDVPTELQANEACVRYIRKLAGVKPFVKQIDTLAAEFPAETNYLYLTYNGIEHDIDLGNPDAALPDPFTHQTQGLTIPDPIALSYSGGYPTQSLVGLDQKDGGEPRSRVIVLGCGPYRIGSSVEFDWCCVNCIKTLRSLGHEVGVINCNPETVSTDFDESNRLYFEELSQEVVLAIAEMENPGGVVVSVGGQTPNNLAMGLHKNGVKILGTSVEAIDACENRFRFSQLCDALRIDQPEWSEFTTIDEALHFVKRVGYPVLVRPSYVLSGAAMRVVTDNAELERFLRTAAIVSRDYPVVISNYIAGAKEVELDAVGCNGNLLNYAIAEHVENAGVHSGDATLLLPAQKLFVETHRRVKQIGQKICRALKISGPFNIQFICKENEVKVIECNLRASRSMPYISKTYNVNFIELATRVMLGQQIAPAVIQPIDMDHIAVKVPVFSFDRLLNSDPRLGVEMQSTGEVACFGVNQYEAFLKGMIAKGFRLPTKNILVCIGPQQQKIEFLPYVEKLVDMGFQIYATKNTHDVLLRHGLEKAILVYKPLVKREPNTATMLSSGKLDLVINVPDSMDSQALTDGFALRRTSVDCGVPLIVDIKTAILTVMALHRKWSRETSGRAFFSFSSWQEYVQPPEVPATA